MKEEKDIRLDIVRVEGDAAPFVEVYYLDRDVQERTGLLLLDSGSTINFLSAEMLDNISESSKLNCEEKNICTIGTNSFKADSVRFSFALGGKLFSETFCISKHKLPIEVKGEKVIGLIGNRFMLKHKLAIDFSDFTLYTSKVNPKILSISDCSFFFPMDIGLKHYSLPVLAIRQKAKELVTMVDTGSASNMISEQALSEYKFNCSHTDVKDLVACIDAQFSVGQAFVRFSLLTLKEECVSKITRYDYFNVLSTYIDSTEKKECDEYGNRLPSIEALLGAQFLAKERWILDFGARIIYKRKRTDRLGTAV